MKPVGIDAINIYCGEAFIDVGTLFEARGLDRSRMDNLMMKKKSVALHCEDPVSCAVNAAKPIIDALTEEQKNSIELLIVATESGIDFGKAISTYVHDKLGLPKSCRLFETKQACYAGTAAMQMAASVVAASPFPDPRALVISSDVARTIPKSYAEPSQGVGAVAVLVGRNPRIAELDFGMSGFHSYEVMDTCRPTAEIETGDADVSLLSYIDCLENAYRDYERKVEGADFQSSFDFLAMHTPFPGMVKGAHRTVMRKLKKLPPPEIEADFEKRLRPSIKYCQEVGNIYGGTAFLAIVSTIENAALRGEERLGVFSYGSGCSSEFYSMVISEASKAELARMRIADGLASRHSLSMAEYDELLGLHQALKFGTKDFKVDMTKVPQLTRNLKSKKRLVLTHIENYHRHYEWLA